MQRTVAKQMVRDGRSFPDTMAQVPELRVGLQFYIEAFFDLDSDRQTGEQLGRIPWKSVKEYAETYELDDEQTADLFFFIREMDTDHLKRIAAKRKDRAKHGPKSVRPFKKNAPRRR